eukprot:SAG31_NODE_6608_length_1953_cov_2.028587_1_plen_158_part_00
MVGPFRLGVSVLGTSLEDGVRPIFAQAWTVVHMEIVLPVCVNALMGGQAIVVRLIHVLVLTAEGMGNVLVGVASVRKIIRAVIVRLILCLVALPSQNKGHVQIVLVALLAIAEAAGRKRVSMVVLVIDVVGMTVETYATLLAEFYKGGRLVPCSWSD